MERRSRPRVLADRYELIEVIASGGSATVWRAHDERLARDVAIKILLPGLSSDPTFQRRMEREARHIASLKSPNVVGIYDVGASPDGPFIVMELVDGTSLRELIDDAGTLGPDDVLSIAVDVLSALILAHQEGLVHRDIKPSNVLITSEGVAKLTDFGISRSAAQTTEITAAGLFTGTIAYAAPEQLAGEAVSEASDLYSLGCVLYECLSGHPLFEADDANRLAFQQRFADPAPIGDRVAGVPPAVSACIMRALEKEPGRRYQDASAMLTAIRTAHPELPRHRTVRIPVRKTQGAGVGADRQPRERTVGARRNRRHVRIILAGLALVAVALAATAIVVWYPSTQGATLSSLRSGAKLEPSESLLSQNGRYRLMMQPNGSLSLEVARTGEPIWATGSGGHPGASAVMQDDGNLEVLDTAPSVLPRRQAAILYQTSTSGHAGASLQVLDDGNLVIQDPSSGRWLWQSGSGPDSLGSKLIATQGLHPLQDLQSPNGAFELTNDGWTGQLRLLAVRSPKCSIWTEPAAGSPASVSALLPDGEFVMLAPLSHETWTSGTSGNPNSELVLGNDGTLTLTSATGTVLWRAPVSRAQSRPCTDR